jgi:hypothetical protein
LSKASVGADLRVWDSLGLAANPWTEVSAVAKKKAVKKAAKKKVAKKKTAKKK